MKRKLLPMTALLAVITITSLMLLNEAAEARIGGGRSLGSRGSRSYLRPASPYSQPRSAPQSTPQPAPSMTPPPYQQPQPVGGGFFRNMAGGILGGMLGGMLFRSLGFGGNGIGGSGIGLFEILLVAGIGWLLFRMMRGARRSSVPAYDYHGNPEGGGNGQPFPQQAQPVPLHDLQSGLAHIRQMDAGFDEQRFSDQVMDLFFRIQAAWMHRDLTPVAQLLTGEMSGIFQEDLDRLLREQRINRLENIAVRRVEIVEAWQEQGEDFITTLIYANLLDYTTDESGRLVAGSDREPVKFEEYWTFTRPVGSGDWRLCAIDQK